MNSTVEIDCNRNIGIISIIKNYMSMTYDKALIALNAGWNSRSDTEGGYFNFCMPLNKLLGFCGDYKCVIVNTRHELILIRTRNDYNCLVGNPVMESEIELFKVQCRMSHVALNEINKLSMLRALENGYLSMSGICTNILCYRLRPNIHGLSKLNLRSRHYLCSVERMPCHEMLACSTTVI